VADIKMLNRGNDPLTFFRNMESLFPSLWVNYRKMTSASARTALGDWPAWCYAPMAAAYALVGRAFGVSGPLDAKQVSLVPIVATIAAWRADKYVYQFDPTLFEALVEQYLDVDAALPSEVLLNLPAHGIYIDTLDLIPNTLGVFVFLEYDVNNGDKELRFFLLAENKQTGFALPAIHLGGSLLEGLKETQRQADIGAIADLDVTEVIGVDIVSLVKRLLQLVLYVCAENADVISATKPIKKKEFGEKVALSPCIWHAGTVVGEVLRAYHAKEQKGHASDSHASPKPHIDKAQWHTYITGPKDDESQQQRILRWVSPILVGGDADSHYKGRGADSDKRN